MFAAPLLLVALAQPVPAPAPDLAPTPPPQPSALAPAPTSKGTIPAAMLSASGLVLLSDLLCVGVTAFGISHIRIDPFGSSNEPDDPLGALTLVGAASCLFVTPLAAVTGARWAGVDGNRLVAYWATFGARLAWLAAAGVLNANVIGKSGGPALVILPYAIGELLFQPWVAARVLQTTGPRARPEAPPLPSPAEQALPVRDPADASGGRR